MSKLFFYLFTSLFMCTGLTKETSTSDDFTIINNYSQKYQRSFTILSLDNDQHVTQSILCNAAMYPQGIFAIFQKANNFSSLMPSKSVFSVNISKLKNIIWLNHFITAEELYILSLCENFDIIVISDILFRFPLDWKQILKNCQNMAQIVIVKLPISLQQKNASLYQQICHYFESIQTADKKTSYYTNASQNGTYYIIESPGPFYLKRTSVITPSKGGSRVWEIHSDHKHKKLIKTVVNTPPPAYQKTFDWISGINLITYAAFNGTIPERKKMLTYLPIDFKHPDWMPANMILQGSKRLVLIDGDDPCNDVSKGGSTYWCQSNLSRTKKFILDTANKKTLKETREIFAHIYHLEDYFGIQKNN